MILHWKEGYCAFAYMYEIEAWSICVLKNNSVIYMYNSLYYMYLFIFMTHRN